jgi:hypothetical protein
MPLSAVFLDPLLAGTGSHDLGSQLPLLGQPLSTHRGGCFAGVHDPTLVLEAAFAWVGATMPVRRGLVDPFGGFV